MRVGVSEMDLRSAWTGQDSWKLYEEIRKQDAKRSLYSWLCFSLDKEILTNSELNWLVGFFNYIYGSENSDSAEGFSPARAASVTDRHKTLKDL